jgi:hypothetical protein
MKQGIGTREQGTGNREQLLATSFQLSILEAADADLPTR